MSDRSDRIVRRLTRAVAPPEPIGYIVICDCMISTSSDGLAVPTGGAEHGECPLCGVRVAMYEVITNPFKQMIGDKVVSSSIVRRIQPDELIALPDN
jgi:hypothetical protein